MKEIDLLLYSMELVPQSFYVWMKMKVARDIDDVPSSVAGIDTIGRNESGVKGALVGQQQVVSVVALENDKGSFSVEIKASSS